MDRAQERRSGRRTDAELEVLVHGVGGATPEKTLGDPRTVRITGDDTAAVFRRAEDAEDAADSEGRKDARDGPVQEAYVSWADRPSRCSPARWAA
ncbi:hypothetical protein AB0478_20580 [Streptomyces sp. NPDC051917]|uniref:hypothetical protein n=1 Tax=Streptomyces sp. NPDC051917 TaxID=3154754 RepID=UPI00344F3912